MKQSLDEIVSGFDPCKAGGRGKGSGEEMIGVWIPKEYKQQYESIQKNSGRSFSKTIRALVLAAIDKVSDTKTA